jgi:alpha-D-ribose 1-methylphosphonate 5-triphosphate synthase subunit PhnG
MTIGESLTAVAPAPTDATGNKLPQFRLLQVADLAGYPPDLLAPHRRCHRLVMSLSCRRSLSIAPRTKIHTIDSLSGPILSTTDQALHTAADFSKNQARPTPESRHDADRRAAMAVLAEARVDEIEQGLQSLAEPVDHVELRAAETGLVMLRGRIGGDGAPFNLGEATVTRAAVQIATGEVGFAYILGRDQKKARLCALCDALWQSKRHRDAVERRVLAPVRVRLDGERGQARAETAATRVDFLTLVRGED